MKDAKGHGSDAHSTGVQQIGVAHPTGPLPYGVRADHDKREYSVYHVASDKNVATYPYKQGESARGIAQGKANMHRDSINRTWREGGVSRWSSK
jgi:hypothetical protein